MRHCGNPGTHKSHSYEPESKPKGSASWPEGTTFWCSGFPGEPEHKQVDRLADYILSEVPGEPSQDQGAVDTAIRLISKAMELHGDRAFSADGRALREDAE